MSANELIDSDCQEDFLDDCPHTDTTPQVDVDAREAARVGAIPSYILIINGVEHVMPRQELVANCEAWMKCATPHQLSSVIGNPHPEEASDA